MANTSGKGSGDRPRLAPEVLAYYEQGRERDPLSTGYGPLERERTREVLDRHLPPPPAVILDIGGGAGVHALWLAARGYEVHLRDPVPTHIDQAVAFSKAVGVTLASAVLGDARALDFEEKAADAVLMLGPLYHLQEAADRRRALEEARRVLRDDGLLAVAAISRWAPVLDGLRRSILKDLLEDSELRQALEKGIATGRFDPVPKVGFTRMYFHRPNELRNEVAAADFAVEDLVGLEGIGFAMDDFTERWADPAGRAALLEAARRTERVPELLGMSPHLLLVASRGSHSTEG